MKDIEWSVLKTFLKKMQFFEYQNKKKGVGDCNQTIISTFACAKIILITWRFLLSLDAGHMIHLE